MKKFFLSLSILLSATAFSGCSDFFDPETDDMLPGEDYISSDLEMYSGFLGILTKLQDVADKELLLTETRGDVLETTTLSSPEIAEVFSYTDDLHGNSYADPAPYYETVIACNDYLEKMRSYRKVVGVDQDLWQQLVSCAVRVKAWTYKTIAEIYGEAVWFDSPVTSLPELTAGNGFELLPVDKVMDRAATLMLNGWEGVPANLEVDFIAMFDPDNVTSPASSDFRKWNFSIPPYEGVLAELLLWKGAALDAQGQTDAATPVYKQCADLLLARLQQEFESFNQSDRTYWLICTASKSRWQNLFSSTDLDYMEVVAAVLYDYTHDQTNAINSHLLNSGYNRYQLKPSEVAMNLWEDTSFNPGGAATDSRFSATYNNRGSVDYVCKYSRVSGRTSYDDIPVILYRATQYHFYLMEALNHLKRYTPFSHLLNDGMDGLVTTETDHETDFLLDPQWEGFTNYWTKTNPGKNYKSGNQGIRGMQGVPARKLYTDPRSEGVSDAEAIRHNDLQLLDEAILEFAVEGRNYAFMNRMALRYGDLSIVADRVCPKYEPHGLDAQVRAKILAGGNYVHYPLQIPN